MLSNKSKFWPSLAFLMLGIITLAGCGKAPPEIVPVTGTVNFRNAPLGNVEVKFLPMSKELDGNYVASGITNKAGEFTLHLQGKTEPGCCAFECKVLIVEGPIPGDTRAQDEKSLLAAANFRKKLKNRPIPKKYERPGTTPLSFTVSAENNKFEIELTQ
jgi:hypothetical protein